MERVRLGSICRPKQWKTLTGKELVSDGKYPVYGANGIIGYYNEYNHEKETLLIGCRGTCGALNICKNHSYVNGNAMALDNLDEDINVKYLYYALMGRGLKDVISGAVQPQIIRSDLEKIEVLVGTKEEQEIIIDIFDRLDTLIVHRQQELRLLDDLTKARFVELFENGEYPVEKLGAVCTKITDGTHKTPNYLVEGVTFISAKNIINGELDFSDVKYISEEEYQEIQKRCQTEKLDILLSKSGSLGSPAIVRTDEKLGLFESLAVLKYDRTKIVPEFLCEQLKTEKVQRQFSEGTKGVAIKHLHLGVISDTNIIIPSMEEQAAFADFVKQVDKSKSVVQKSLDEAKLLFDSLMQEYFG